MSNPFDQFASEMQAALPPGAAPAPASTDPFTTFSAPPPAAPEAPKPVMNAPPQQPYGYSGQPAYGAPPPQQPAYGAPPPQQPYGAPPQQQPFGAPPPQQPPFGAPPPQQQPPAYLQQQIVPAPTNQSPYAFGPPPGQQTQPPAGQPYPPQNQFAPAPPTQPPAPAPAYGGFDPLMSSGGAPPQQPADAYNPFGAPPPQQAPVPGSDPFGAGSASVPPASNPPVPPAGAAPFGMPPAGVPPTPTAAPPTPADPWSTPAAPPAQPPGPPAADPMYGALVPAQPQAHPAAIPPSDDPFALFNAAPPPAPVPAAPPAQGPPSATSAPRAFGDDIYSTQSSYQAAPAPPPAAVTNDLWGDMGMAPPTQPAPPPPGAPGSQPTNSDGLFEAPVKATEPGQPKESELPPGGEWYDARIFTPTLGVMFFKPQELTDSLFLNTDRELVDGLLERPVVAFIVEGSSARSAGVELGHVLLKVNGIDVKNPKEASRLIKEGPRPLPLLFYVPNTEVVVAEGEHMVKYDTRETTAPNSAKDWKPKYVVIGGIIAQPWMMNMYRSKSEYDIAVIETQARRPVSVKVKQFSLQGARIQNDWQGPQMVKYKNKLHPWKYVVILPVARNPIKISSPNLTQLKPVHEGIRRVLLAQQRDRGANHHSAAPPRASDPYSRNGGDPYGNSGAPPPRQDAYNRPPPQQDPYNRPPPQQDPYNRGPPQQSPYASGGQQQQPYRY